MQRVCATLAVWLVLIAAHATVTVGPWMPLFKGIDHARGQMLPDAGDPRRQVVNALRIDLTDPDIRFFPSPPCANCGAETLSATPSQFLRDHALQAVFNCSFFYPNMFDPGLPMDVMGLAISEGVLVSPPDNLSNNAAVLLFTPDNRPVFIPENVPPTNTAGIFTAVSGNVPLVVHGQNVAPFPDPWNPDLDPRTALGLSQDERFLYVIVIDGRQPGYSDSASYYDAAEWLLRFGAYHGMNVDGGSSSTIAIQDCAGRPVRLNQNSYVALKGYERADGHLFGLFARPHPFIGDVTVIPADTSATVLWNTAAAASSQVEYGLTTVFGESLPLNSVPVTNHAATLCGLIPSTNYYFRVNSAAGGTNHVRVGQFSTTLNVLLPINARWRYTTNNLDGKNWQASDYNDAAWLGPDRALLFVEGNANVAPQNTPLPSSFPLPPTYYFRTHFQFSGNPAGVSLTFSNHIDDGAVFYLNGIEIFRLRMPSRPQVISYSSQATGSPCPTVALPCAGDACTNCLDLFTLSPEFSGSLRQGDNVLAVEVHNFGTTSPDIVFGTAAFFSRQFPQPLELHALRSGDVVILHWNGEGLTLQQAEQLTSQASWTDVPGQATGSPCFITNRDSTFFYRLRN